MDYQTFSSLKSQLKQPFFSNKKAALQSFTPNYWFSGEQTAEILGEFPHGSEKEEVLGLIAPRLTSLTGEDAKKIVDAFTFASGKLKAVELIASRINDPVGKYVVLDAIDFHSDKEKARKILDQASPAAAPSDCGTHHHHHHHHHHGNPSEPVLPPQTGPGSISVNFPGMPGLSMPGFPQISFNASVPGTTGPPPSSQYPGQPGSTGYGAPPPATSGYSQPPASGYGAPPTGYPGAPPTGYPPQGALPTGYGAPPTGYPPQGAPPTGYGAPPTGYPQQQPPPGGYPYGYPPQ